MATCRVGGDRTSVLPDSPDCCEQALAMPSLRFWLLFRVIDRMEAALANALQESARFERAQPNWWLERVRK